MPVGGGDERAALETVFERQGQRARRSVEPHIYRTRQWRDRMQVPSVRPPRDAARARRRRDVPRVHDGAWSGFAGERVRFGADCRGARERIERDVRAQFVVARGAARDAPSMQLAARPDGRRWSSADARHGAARAACSIGWPTCRASAAAARTSRSRVYGPEARPLALGRPPGHAAHRPHHGPGRAVSGAELRSACG